VGLLSKYGLSGTFDLPTQSQDSEVTLSSIERYLSFFSGELDNAVAAASSDVEYQERVLNQGMNVVLQNG
jgi:hypothetical protein